jgi:hypothetical protein
VSDLRSDFFIPGPADTTIDTRFLVDAKESVNVPLFRWFSGKVSLAPTVEFIWYSNKISRNLYYSAATSITLSYSF